MTSDRAGLVGLIAGLCLLGSPLPAAAADRVVELPFTQLSGVQLAGSTAVYPVTNEPGGGTLLHEVGSFGNRIVLSTSPGNERGLSIATSPDLVVAAEPSTAFGVGSLLLAGAPGGLLRQIAACPPIPTDSPGAPFTALAVDGTNIAYTDTSCEGHGATAIVVRSSTGALLATLPLPAGATINDFRLSGDEVAYVQNLDEPSALVVVQNWATGATLFSAPPEDPPGPTRHSGDGFASLALAPDGSPLELIGNYLFIPGPVVKGEDTSYFEDICKGRIDRLSSSTPAQPIESGGACENYLLVAGGAVLYQSSHGLATAIEPDGTTHTVALGTDASAPLAFDGTNVYVPNVTCTDQSIIRIHVATGPQTLPGGAECTAVLAHAKLTLRPRPRLTATLTCPAGCRGPLVVELSSGSFGSTIRSRPLLLAPGGQTHLVISPHWSARTVRAAARHSRLTTFSHTTGPAYGPSTLGRAIVHR